MQFIIAGRDIGPENPPYICAEISANHNGKLENALELIRQAKIAGADAVKIQTYRPDTITLRSSNPEFQITTGPWAGRTLYDLYEEAHLPWEWHAELFRHAREQQITLFSSPFDETAVDLLEELGAPAYKIASFEIVDLELIRYAASTQKPIVISTGLATPDDMKLAIETVKSTGNHQVMLLHCVSGYPVNPCEYNLQTICDMRNNFEVEVGLSDHTLSNVTAIGSIMFGASFIEKHFTLDRNAGGPDDSFSMEPGQLRDLVTSSLEAWQARGEAVYNLQPSEESNKQFRRSLFFVSDLKIGTIIKPEHVRSVRPGFGLPPKYLKRVIGSRLTRSIEKNTPVTAECLDRLVVDPE